jgi:hypothetical protein
MTALPPLPVTRLGDLGAAHPEHRWLVEHLWSAQAVGFIAGQPKLGKTWLALDLALSVATATPCLDTYPVRDPGDVLLYLAEDPPHMVRQRLFGLCARRGLDLDPVPIHVITAPTLRLDLADDRDRLTALVDVLKPRLLVLDPLVRLHRRDENHSGEIAELLSYLRELQRAYALAVLVVHHMRKSGAARGGQALRGSGDLHAWTDSALYLQTARGATQLAIEHRAAPAQDPVHLRLATPPHPGALPYLEVICATASRVAQPHEGCAPTRSSALADRLLDLLRSETRPLTRVELRARLRVSNVRLGEALELHERHGAVRRTAHGWQIQAHRLPGETESGSAGTQPDKG